MSDRPLEFAALDDERADLIEAVEEQAVLKLAYLDRAERAEAESERLRERLATSERLQVKEAAATSEVRAKLVAVVAVAREAIRWAPGSELVVLSQRLHDALGGGRR